MRESIQIATMLTGTLVHSCNEYLALSFYVSKLMQARSCLVYALSVLQNPVSENKLSKNIYTLL